MLDQATATLDPFSEADTERTIAPPRLSGRGSWILGCGVVLLTGLVRIIGLGSLNQVSVDEIFYTHLGNSVAHGRIPPNFPPGEGDVHQVFLLHPPGFFMLEAAWQWFVGRPAELVDQVVRARELNLILAMVTVGLLGILGTRLAGRRGGLAAGLLFALDPFLIRENGMVLLETATVLWVVAGLVVLVRVASGASARPRLAALAGGLLFGCAIVTKDLVAVETAGALLAALVTGWALNRRHAAIALVGSVIPYGCFVVACAAQGHLGDLFSDKTVGIRRALGLTVSTGFNKVGSPSLAGTLVSQVTTFGGSYLLVGIGTLCGTWLAWKCRRPDHRLVGLVTVFAALLLLYSAGFGTIEEQFLYLLAVPGLVATVIVAPSAVARIRQRQAHRPRRHRRTAVSVLALSLTVVSACNGTAWARQLPGAHNELGQLVGWIGDNVPRGERVAYAEGVIQFALQSDGYQTVPLGFPQNMARSAVRYFVVIPREVEQNYTFVSLAAFNFYRSHSTVVFHSSPNSLGRDVQVLKTTDPSVW